MTASRSSSRDGKHEDGGGFPIFGLRMIGQQPQDADQRLAGTVQRLVRGACRAASVPMRPSPDAASPRMSCWSLSGTASAGTASARRLPIATAIPV
jgi:hypothetical protein